MPTFFVDQFGHKRKWSDVSAVNELFRLKQANGSNPWPVIEKILDVWKARPTQEWKAYLVQLGEIKATRKDRKFASTKDKVTGGYLRYTLDIPERVIHMIRCMYSSTELNMNREFFREFGKRFPAFRIAEKS